MADETPPAPTPPSTKTEWVRLRLARAWTVLVRLRTLRRKIDDLDTRLDAAVKVRDEALEALGTDLLEREALSDLVQTFAQTARELADKCVTTEAHRDALDTERAQVVAERDAALSELDASLTAAEKNWAEKRAALRSADDELSQLQQPEDEPDAVATPALEAAEALHTQLQATCADLEAAVERLEAKRRRRATAFEARLDDLDAHIRETEANLVHLDGRRRATLVDLGREGLSLDDGTLDAEKRDAAVEALETIRGLRRERGESVSARASLDLGPLWRVSGAMLLALIALGLLWRALA